MGLHEVGLGYQRISDTAYCRLAYAVYLHKFSRFSTRVGHRRHVYAMSSREFEFSTRVARCL